MLRCVTYNIGFGFDNRRLADNAKRVVSYLLHDAEAIRKGTRHVEEALDLALSLEADILCLNEIAPDISGTLVEGRLREAGYRTVVHGVEFHNKPPLRFGTYLAVKWPGEQLSIRPPHIEAVGSGAGWCAMEVPGENLVLYAVHPGLWPPFRREQMLFLKEEMRKQQAKGKKVIAIGDFNLSLKVLLDSYGFSELGVAGAALPTNLVWRPWPLSYFSYDDLDHVLFTPEFRLAHQETHAGLSDHKLLLCDLEVIA